MLFERHTAQNRGLLREDEMLRRIDELKIKLNISWEELANHDHFQVNYDKKIRWLNG